MEVVLSRATSTEVPTAAGQPTSWLVTQGHFDVPNRAERIWPLTDEPGAAGERPPFRPMTSAG